MGECGQYFFDTYYKKYRSGGIFLEAVIFFWLFDLFSGEAEGQRGYAFVTS